MPNQIFKKMRKLILGVFAVYTFSVLLTSCSTENNALGAFGKRKYLKNFKETKSTQEITIDEHLAKIEKVVPENVEKNNNTSEDIQSILEVPTLTQQDIEVAIKATKKKVAKQLNEEYRHWDKFDRNYSNELLASTDMQTIKMLNKKAASQVNEIVLAILAIFIPPLAVFLFDDAINANFWVDLLLTFLFWIPGVIFAFLVIFAGVSV